MALTTPSVSPAIVVKEIDLTGVAPNVETSLSGFVGQFNWGPVNVPTRIQDEGQLAAVFGTPSTTTAVDYFSAAQYLRYSGNLIVNRQVSQGVSADSAYNATLSNQQVLIENEEQWENTVSTEMFTARYPGALGNSLGVSIFSIESGDSVGSATSIANFAAWQWQDKFDGIPSTSDWATNFSNSVKNDEVHVAVIDRGGFISGTKNTVLEIFPYVSVAAGAKTIDGGDNHIKSVLNNSSDYVLFGKYFDSDNMIVGTKWGSAVPTDGTAIDFASGVSWSNDSANATFVGGSDHSILDAGDYALGFDNFEDKDEIDIQILIAPGMATSSEQITVVNDLAGIASVTRKDCVVVASPDRAAVVGTNSPTADTILTTNQFTASNYLIVDNNYLRVYNKYADQYIYVPAASSTAGLLAATDANYGPWYSPAGERRGEYFGVTALAHSPNKAERDALYKVGVNPIVQFSGRGILLFGDKTKQARPSAFDRINVRRLFLAVEKSIALAARNFMFEFNDEFTRSEFVAITEPLLREIQARRGIEEFYVQCDARNNTDEVRARNELVASVFIKPAYAINFITLNFVATRAGLDFEEVIGTLS